MATLICPQCHLRYDGDRLRIYKCPECKDWLIWETEEPTANQTSTPITEDFLEDLDPATKAIVSASNRTTHAVRSLAIFFFTWIRTVIYASVIAGIGQVLVIRAQTQFEINAGLIAYICAGLVVLVGFFVALGKGLKELRLSSIQE